MGKAELGQVVDRGVLDASTGSRGRVRLAIPERWARDGGDIELTVPVRVTCARCDGGGCDGCERSGAHRTPAEPAGRTLRLRLPRDPGCTVTLRLVRPFGDQAPLDQLLVEIDVSAGDASPGITRIEPPPAPPLARPARLRAPLVVALLVAAAAVIGLLASR
jgi:hypothetical protein